MFTFIANHILEKKEEQLLMIITGAPGVDKSRAIHALGWFFHQYERDDAYSTYAGTAWAAANILMPFIVAQTIFAFHALDVHQNQSKRTAQALTDRADGLRYAIGDEMAMCTPKHLEAMSRMFQSQRLISTFCGFLICPN